MNTIEKHHHVFTGVPTFFRACCSEAAKGRVWSSSGWIRYGYQEAGYQLARHTGELSPDTADFDDWEDQMDWLFTALINSNRSAVLRWYEKTYPVCMALVPRKRRSAFVDGVIEASEEGEINL
jgi:hypothetical protein